MFTRPLIERKFGRIDTYTPYNEVWVQAIKSVIPSRLRTWDPQQNKWSFDARCYEAVSWITRTIFGPDMVKDLVIEVPNVTLPGWRKKFDAFLHIYSRKNTDYENNDHYRFHREQGKRWKKDGVSPDTKWALDILGLGSDPSMVEIRSAYRTAARKAHPDQGGDHDRMLEVNRAYEFLKNTLV